MFGKKRVSVALADRSYTMPAYNTRSGARDSPASQVPGSAAGAAGTVQDSTAVPSAEVHPTSSESTYRPMEVTGASTGIMAEFPQSLKDPSIILLRAEFNAAHSAVDRTVTEVDKHVQDIEQAKDDTSVPKERLRDFSTRLDTLLTKGDGLLDTLESKQELLIKQLDYLSMTYEDQPELKEPVDLRKNRVRSVFSP